MFMSPSSYLCAQGVAENNQFFDWKESDYKAYEDSLLKACRRDTDTNRCFPDWS